MSAECKIVIISAENKEHKKLVTIGASLPFKSYVNTTGIVETLATHISIVPGVDKVQDFFRYELEIRIGVSFDFFGVVNLVCGHIADITNSKVTVTVAETALNNVPELGSPLITKLHIPKQKKQKDDIEPCSYTDNQNLIPQGDNLDPCS